MKRMLFFLIACFIIYIIYFDLTTGSLPQPQIRSAEPATLQVEKKTQSAEGIPFKMVKIKPGDTLLSIIEKQDDGRQISIEDTVADFIALNNGLQPERIQIGKTYKIPDYKK
ncbi:LysM peptidoglycan-binding domain-containing protein [Peribacillus sp. SCS-155]|uniref:LysM peptidoglycan-binding domain-containing protein n=1 Tax=Peribacillus sedimenti TaxID=3115297 RepID=UPI003906A20A